MVLFYCEVYIFLNHISVAPKSLLLQTISRNFKFSIIFDKHNMIKKKVFSNCTLEKSFIEILEIVVLISILRFKVKTPLEQI